MDKLTIAICEDSAHDRDRLEQAIARTGIACACDWFESGEALLESFDRGKYDLLFLDVYMGGMTGVEAAKHVREIDPDVMMAFVTTSPDFAMEGYRSRVERYLLKPYGDEDVREAILSARRKADALKEESLNVAGQEVPHSSISYAEQSNHTTMVHLVGGGELRRTGKLDDLEQALPCPPFYRCHKSYLVNLDHVLRLDRELNVFVMEDGGTAYVRRASVGAAKRAFEARLIELTKRL